MCISFLSISSYLHPKNLYNMHWQFRQTIYTSITCSCASIFYKGEFWPTSFSIDIPFYIIKKKIEMMRSIYWERFSLTMYVAFYMDCSNLYAFFLMCMDFVKFTTQYFTYDNIKWKVNKVFYKRPYFLCIYEEMKEVQCTNLFNV